MADITPNVQTLSAEIDFILKTLKNHKNHIQDIRGENALRRITGDPDLHRQLVEIKAVAGIKRAKWLPIINAIINALLIIYLIWRSTSG